MPQGGDMNKQRREELKRGKLRRKIRRMRRPVQFFYRWFDFWVGAYYDRAKKTLYLCFLGFGIKIRCGKVRRSTPIVQLDHETHPLKEEV
jgi:hypothetical protein